MSVLTKHLRALSFAAIGRIAPATAIAVAMWAAPSFVKAQSADLVLCDRAKGCGRRQGLLRAGRGALGDDDAKKALKRMECAHAIKDRRGNLVTNLCF
jgi:hypothetical protein